MKNIEMKKLIIYKNCPICGNDTKVIIKCNDKQYEDYSINYKGLIIHKKPIQDISPYITLKAIW